MATNMDEKGSHQGMYSVSKDEIELRGMTICSGIGISRARVLGRQCVVLRGKIPADHAQAEIKRDH